MNDQFTPYDSCNEFEDVDNGYEPSIQSQYDPCVIPHPPHHGSIIPPPIPHPPHHGSIIPPPIPHPPHHGSIIPIQLKDVMRYIGDVNTLPEKPNSHTMAKYAEYGNRIVQYGDVVRQNNCFYIYGYNKDSTKLEWIIFGNQTSSITQLSSDVLSIQNVLEQTYRKNQTSSSIQLNSKFNSLSNDFVLNSKLTAYATKEALSTLDTRVARNEIFIGSHEDRLCCHAKKIDGLVVDFKSLSDDTSSYVTWNDFSSKTTSAEVSDIVEGYNFAKKPYVDEIVNQTSSILSNDLTTQFNELVLGLASNADLEKLSAKVINQYYDTNASIGELFSKTAHLKSGVEDLYNKVANLDTLCVTVDSKLNNIYLEINNTNNKIDIVEQSLQNYVKLSTLNDIVLSVVTNTNNINSLALEFLDVKFKVQDNTQHIDNLTQDLTSFKQEVDHDYAKKNSLSAYVEKTQFNGTSAYYDKKVYPVKLCADNNAYVNVPWNDKFVQSAWYEQDIQTVWVEFTDGQQLSICISGLVDIYTAGYGLALSSNEFYVSADYILRPELIDTLSNYYTKSETSSASEVGNALYTVYQTLDENYYKKTETSSASELSAAFDAESQVFITDIDAGISDIQSDLYIKKVNAEEFYVADSKLSNTLYILTGDVLRAYGMRITDVAEPEDVNDAVTKQYVDDTAKEDKLYTNAVIKTVSSEITSDISALQDDTTYISGWISSNFENVDAAELTTVLKHDVSATQDLSVAGSLFVNGTQFRITETVDPETSETVTKAETIADVITFSNASSDNATTMSLSYNKAHLSNAQVYIDAVSSFTLNADSQQVINATSSCIDIMSTLSIETTKATATALSTNMLSVSSFSNIVADDVSCSVADLCVGLSNSISTLNDEFAKYKQNVKSYVNEISAVNILSSSNMADIISSIIKIKDIIAALSTI